MGAPDGAEVCELVGLFLLNEVKENFPKLNFGLYRDDGLAVHKQIPGPQLERMKKSDAQIIQIPRPKNNNRHQHETSTFSRRHTQPR